MTDGRTLFSTQWFELRTLEQGSEPYYFLHGPDAVVIFAISTIGDVLLVGQHRPARGHKTLELPAGGVEPGETPLAAATRELREETGYVAGELHALGRGGLRLDRDDAWVHTFVAFEAEPATAVEDRSEVVLMPQKRFYALIAEGRFEQLGALAAVLQALLRFPNRLTAIGPNAP